ncbi:MAG: MarR family transcriptional regulator [Euryarchaeota archaeon]|nr:MarR family transcriptional regulator [Euryarchaeota archaeon]MBU4220678.1 MarR family transcriptional regulator [Euryarchaeota archaeon]MBU4339600.1 MarR family transcriptional regulator [Euryarchaeota archaeon]MCG2735018.1 MarR family transcriptional regulator [Candidatus Methanoperedenaceae archaeon]
MAEKENIKRILDAFDGISRVFASMESFHGDSSISKPELLALEAISKEEGLMMSDLGKRLDISLSTATGIIDRLIEKKLVKRERNGGDRRVVRVVLTDKGRKTNQTYQKQKKELFGRMLGALDPEEQGELIKILEKIAGAIKQEA